MEIDRRYIDEVRKNSQLSVEMIKKDLVLSYLLQGLHFEHLIFKGGTLLSKGHLNYHRLSEDLDFTYLLGDFPSLKKKKSYIKKFVKNEFIPRLVKICEQYGLDFKDDSEDQDSKRYCPVKSSNFLFRFNVYLDFESFVKIEINFLDSCYVEPVDVKMNHLNPHSEYLIYPLMEYSILSYSVYDVILEKLRAILTRDMISERDFFDLFLLEKEFGEVFDISLRDLILKLKDSRLYEKGELLDVIDSFRRRFSEDLLLGEIYDMTLIEFDREEYLSFVRKLVDFLLSLRISL